MPVVLATFLMFGFVLKLGNSTESHSLYSNRIYIDFNDITFICCS